MNYYTASELAAQWGVDTSRILRLAREGRIVGATHTGNRWMFPVNARKPEDSRTKAAKASGAKGGFRFPLLLNQSEDAYTPPLSEEEQQLRLGQLEFFACRFEAAKKYLEPLSAQAKNRYVRIAALVFCCYLAVYDIDCVKFNDRLRCLTLALAEDFPYKKEMTLMRIGLFADGGYYSPALDDFSVEPEYTYHASACNMLVLVSILTIQNTDFSLVSRLRYDVYEHLCQQMELGGDYLEAQKLHYLLVIVYQLQNRTDRLLFHVRRGLEIAMERELYWSAAFYERYDPDFTHKALEEFPKAFSEKICALGRLIQERQARFAYERKNATFLSILSSSEYKFAFFANQGYSYAQVAKNTGCTLHDVVKKYNTIFRKLGVKGKRELVALINGTHATGDPADGRQESGKEKTDSPAPESTP